MLTHNDSSPEKNLLYTFFALIIFFGVITLITVMNLGFFITTVLCISIPTGITTGLTVIFIKRNKKRAEAFFKDQVLSRGWKYLDVSEVSTSSEFNDSFLFSFKKNHALKRRILGTCQGSEFEFSEYSLWETPLGKIVPSYLTAVVRISFSGTFPHLFLRNKKVGKHKYAKYGYGAINVPAMAYHESSRVLSEVPLSEEYNKYFKLFAPPDYEIEALSIFNPERIEKLINLDWKYNIELIDNNMFIYNIESVENIEELDLLLVNAVLASMLFSTTLNTEKLYPIGDLSYRLVK